MDIYKPYLAKNADDKHLVKVGRITVLVALVIACLVAPLLGSIKEMFQYIQEYTGLVSPGILGVFIMGLFSKKSTNSAAIWGVISSLVIALLLKFAASSMPWMHQMMITWILTMAIIAVISWLENKGKDDEKVNPLDLRPLTTKGSRSGSKKGIIFFFNSNTLFLSLSTQITL